MESLGELPLAYFVIILLVCAIFVAVLVISIRKKFRGPQVEPSPPVRIARIVEDTLGGGGGGGFAALMLIIFSIVATYSYYRAETVFQQIVALLIWIGNSTFWGIFILVPVLIRRRTYVVYRDVQEPPARQEPVP
jgi:hypothetical protein